MRVLVTNDDGVRAPGLAVLARALAEAGHDLLVAAPASEASGASAGIGPLHTMSDGIALEVVKLDGLEGIETLAVEALPALIVLTACLGAFGPPPDLVVAGINPGRNVGRAVLHSGTVGAALTAVHFDKRGLAVSIQSGPFSAFEADEGDRIHFETAAAIAASLAPRVAAAPARTVVNCNVPNLPLHRVRGVVAASVARSGLIRSAVVDDETGSRMLFELGLGEAPVGERSDERLTTRGYATVTPLASVAESGDLELRRHLESALAAVATELDLEHGAPDESAEGPAA